MGCARLFSCTVRWSRWAPSGEGAVNQHRRRFKGKIWYETAVKFRSFLVGFMAEFIHFAPRKRSCTVSPLQCRGERQTMHRHVFSLFFFSSPAIEFSTFFILN